MTIHGIFRRKSGGDSAFYLGKLLDSVVPWAITEGLAGFYSGTHVLYRIYTTGMTHGKPWIAQSTEAQQLNRTDRQLFMLNLHVQTVHIWHRYWINHITLHRTVFTFALSGFPQLPSNCVTVKPPSHPAIKTDAHKSHTSTIMLYKIFLYKQIFPYGISALWGSSVLPISCSMYCALKA